jgi:hypothetical protein
VSAEALAFSETKREHEEMSLADSILVPPPARPDVTRMVCRGAARHLRELGYAIVKEMTFANGRRGDIVALSPSGELWIVEVKSSIADYRVDGKWPDYRDYCDGFLFAVAPEFPREILPGDVGLIVADAYGGELLRPPPRHPLSPARRKMLTIALARLASGRLALVEDPDGLA